MAEVESQVGDLEGEVEEDGLVPHPCNEAVTSETEDGERTDGGEGGN